MTKLSIIIACFNCEKTLEEALASAYTQNISIPFEVVMVDDCSTDGTRALMDSLAKKYADVRCFYHEKNMGGGAARNTATKKASGTLFFCLDSDDILAAGTLGNMVDFFIGHPCDGLGISTSIKFRNRNIHDVAYTINFGYIGEKIPLESLIQKKNAPLNPLYSTFVYTKKAFDITGGYPTDHGFDTQGIAFRFLANGLVAYGCPDAVYLQRVDFHTSYYLREYEAGKVNHNWFKIFDEFLFLFGDQAKKEILSFDLNDPEKNIYTEICDLPEVFARNAASMAQEHCADHKKKELEAAMGATGAGEGNLFDRYWLAGAYIRESRFSRALEILNSLKSEGFSYPAVDEKILIARRCLAGETLTAVLKDIDQKKHYVKLGGRANLFVRAFRKARRMAKNTVKENYFLFKIALTCISIKGNITDLFRTEEYRAYYAAIADIIKKKEIVFDIRFGGLGDLLAFTSLPRLLKEKYGVDFYLSQQSLEKIRNRDIYKLCFEMNPYVKGVKNPADSAEVFRFRSFSRDKSPIPFLFDEKGLTVTETIEKQFGLAGKGIPEIYYRPKKIPSLGNTVLVDKNNVSGKKLSFFYREGSFEKEAAGRGGPGTNMEYIDPKKQDIFAYADMLYSCRYFITGFSGGAALAACFDKPFTVMLPYNSSGTSIDQFSFRRSAGNYIRKAPSA